MSLSNAPHILGGYSSAGDPTVGGATVAATNNSGNTTITPTKQTQTVYLTVGGAARTSIIILSVTNRTDGDRLTIKASLPATADILLDFRNATAGGTALLPAASFAGQVMTTTATAFTATFDFAFNGTAWTYITANSPS